MNRVNRRLILAAIPLVLVNIIAFSGQLAFIRDHVHWPLAGDILFAAALESIALYLAYAAHDALMAEDSAFRLRLASYGFALVIGILNYSHYALNWYPTFEAVAVGLMSVSSPWLWGIYSRRNSRDALKAKGLIEPVAVRLGFTRWLWWPERSFHVFRLAAWTGERSPVLAIEQWEELSAEKPAQDERTTLDTATSQADAVRVAFRELGADQTATALSAWLAERGWKVDPAYIRQIRGADARRQAQNRRKAIHAIPEPASLPVRQTV